MQQSEDEILGEELSALGAGAGGGGGLTRFVAKLTKKNVHEIDLVLPLPFENAVERVVEVRERAGRTVDPLTVRPGGDRQTIRVVASGGAGGMNPVVVTALVKKRGERPARRSGFVRLPRRA